MTLGLYEQRRRRRNRVWWGVARVVFALALIGAAGVFAYDQGSRLAAARTEALDRQLASVTRQLREALEANQVLQAQLAAEQSNLAKLQQRYDRDVPVGALRDVYTLIGEKLNDGLSAERLQAIIRAAEPVKTCDAQVSRKRLVVVTAEGQQTEGTVGSFADASLVVRVFGDAARTDSGQIHAWFDPARPVTVRIARPGGRNEQWTGPLPLHPLIAVGNTEYRFTVAADARGLVQVAMQPCRQR